MRGRHGHGRRTLPVAALMVLVLVVAGCGGSGHYANDPRPPQTKQLSASILRGKVSVSPSAFGAGPVSITIANLTDASQRVSVAKRVNGQLQGGPETSPINPHDTATLSADLAQGQYLLRVEGQGIKPAQVTVGRKRPSSSNDLLQP